MVPPKRNKDTLAATQDPEASARSAALDQTLAATPDPEASARSAALDQTLAATPDPEASARSAALDQTLAATPDPEASARSAALDQTLAATPDPEAAAARPADGLDLAQTAKTQASPGRRRAPTASLGFDRTIVDDFGAGSDVAADALPRGSSVGRYVVLGRLGAGGMGVVYAAYDPELDRRVALKLVLPGIAGSEGRTRMLREAQALAKLSHPNIVTVHDVGTHEALVWLAMEFVQGKTLGAWLRAAPRGWPEVLDTCVRAGRGVAAAHVAGLLHRDIKPDNIMVDQGGRVRVMDFGLARTGDEESAPVPPPPQDAAVTPKVEALAMRITQAGALVGTPAYMAPEQLVGDEIGPAADQFSLCATLWEGLYGVRPFSGDDLAGLTMSVMEGVPTVPKKGRVPSWLRKVLERGLAASPKHRWPSVEALLDALARGRSRARLRRGLAVAGVIGLGAAGVWGWRELDRRDRIAGCDAAGAAIAESWNDNTRAQLRGALLATGVGYAEATADKLMPWLDAKASAWRAARSELCLDREVYGAWSAELAERGQWCLDERRMELEALVTELSRGGARGRAEGGRGGRRPRRDGAVPRHLPADAPAGAARSGAPAGAARARRALARDRARAHRRVRRGARDRARGDRPGGKARLAAASRRGEPPARHPARSRRQLRRSRAGAGGGLLRGVEGGRARGGCQGGGPAHLHGGQPSGAGPGRPALVAPGRRRAGRAVRSDEQADRRAPG
jgi:hypothetical protein